jgi:hypothetical protein
MATDSAKQNYYMTGFKDPQPITCWYSTVEDCINAAVSGKWNGGLAGMTRKRIVVKPRRGAGQDRGRGLVSKMPLMAGATSI